MKETNDKPWNPTACLCLLLILLGVPWLCRAQATSHVDRYDVVLHVDQHNPNASDSNRGTTTRPFQTISPALQQAQSNAERQVSTKVLIHPGLYRETLVMGWPDLEHPGIPISIEAAKARTVTISGSNVWRGWQRVGNSDVYTHRWPYDWGATPDPWDGRVGELGERREMIFVEGVLLTQVLSRSQMQARVNSFYISENRNTAYIHLPPGVEVQNKLIEVAVRPLLFRLTYAKNLTVRGLRFQHANSAISEAAVQISGTNLVMEDCAIEWNNWTGLAVFSSDTTIRRVTANHNGAQGMRGHKNQRVLIEKSETSYNNWRGAMGNFFTWAVGQKFLRARGLTIRGHTSTYNRSPGLWFDWDNADIVVEDSFICHNLYFGLFLEASQGPFTIKGNVICHNQVPSGSNPRGKGGIRVTTAENIVIEGNVLYGNERSQIATIPAAETRIVSNWETGRKMAIKTRNFTVRDNAVVATDASQLLVELENWPHFLDTLVSDRNVWYSPKNAASFVVRSHKLDLPGWRSFTQQDLNSRFADPLFVSPATNNFTTFPGSPWRPRDRQPPSSDR